VEKVLAKEGRLSESQILRCRVRYFVEGGVIGSKKFMNELFENTREQFSKKRKTGAHRIRDVIPEFYSLRDLQLRKFG